MKASNSLRTTNYSNCPCKDCEKRTPVCHPVCELYQNWVIEKEKLRDTIRKNEIASRTI